MEGENSDFYLTPSPKLNLIMGPIVEAKSIKLLEENIRKIIVMFGNAEICQDTKSMNHETNIEKLNFN